jgi:SOS-response transcriptional repressor LexA
MKEEHNFDLNTPQGRLLYIIKVLFDNNKTKFARAMGMKQVQDVYSYLGSKSSILKSQNSRDKLRSLGVNPAWYEFGEGSPFINSDNPSIEYTSIPSLISAHQCGFGSNINDGIELEEVPSEFVKDMKEPYLITASGESMTPIIQPGDKVFVEKSTFQPRNGDIVAVFLNGEYLIKIFYFKNYTLFLKSANENFETITINEYDSFQILGSVTGIYRKIERLKL